VSEAKARFSELVTEAVRAGPQTVTRHGEALVLVVSPKGLATQPEESSYWRLPRVYEPGLDLRDADIDALFLGAAAEASSPETAAARAEAADATPGGTGAHARPDR
jgi:prevent-host-death family protein